MQDNKYLSTVIYPDSLDKLTETSYLIGWNAEQFHCLIAASIPKRLVPQDSKLKDILEKVYIDPSFIASRSRSVAGIVSSPPPLVLGILLVGDHENEDEPTTYQQQSSIWVTLAIENTKRRANKSENEIVLTNNKKFHTAIKLKSIFSVGFKYHSSCYLISYRHQDTDSFECLHNSVTNETTLHNSHERIVASSRANSKLKVDMDHIAMNINASSDLNKFVSSYMEIEMYGRGEWRRTWFTKMEEVLLYFLSQIGVWFYLIGYHTNVRISSFMPVLSWYYRRFRWTNIVALNAKCKGLPRPSVTLNQENLTVHELSFFMYSISYRCSQISKLFRCSAALSLSWNISVHARQYLWLLLLETLAEIIIDITLGLLLGYYLYRSAPSIVLESEHWATFMTEKTLLNTIQWFNNSPGGVKLNPMITKKMGTLVQFFIKLSAEYYFASKFLVLPACYLIACLGACGVSLQSCVVIDLLRIITWPVNLSHMIFSAVFGFMMRLLYSLWLLFNGQKKNVLRDRVDTCEYDPSALLFGVMLFSIMLFAMPNFAAYHYLFVSLRFGIVVSMFCLWQCLLLVKDFPVVRIVCILFSPTILREESYLEMILVREEQNALHGNISPNFSSEHLDHFLQDMSPRVSSKNITKRRTTTTNSAVTTSSSSKKTGLHHTSILNRSMHRQGLAGTAGFSEDHPTILDPALVNSAVNPLSPSSSSVSANEEGDNSPHHLMENSPTSISGKVFTFDQSDVSKYQDKLGFSTTRKKRGEYSHSAAPVSAIALATSQTSPNRSHEYSKHFMLEGTVGHEGSLSFNYNNQYGNHYDYYDHSEIQNNDSEGGGGHSSPNESSPLLQDIPSPSAGGISDRTSELSPLAISSSSTRKDSTAGKLTHVNKNENTRVSFSSNVTLPVATSTASSPPSLLTPPHTTAATTNSTVSDRWRFSNQTSRISSTYFAIQQKDGRWSSIFQRYLRWWRMFFFERKALTQLFWMIFHSRPIFLRILKAPLLIQEQQEFYMESSILASTRKFFQILSSSPLTKISTSSNKTVNFAGIHSILRNTAQTGPLHYDKSRDVISLYWQMIRVASQGFHETLDDLAATSSATASALLGPFRVSPKSQPPSERSPTTHEEERSDEHDVLLPTSPTSSTAPTNFNNSTAGEDDNDTAAVNQRLVAEQVNCQQLLISRRLLIVILLLTIISSVLSISGMLLFGVLLLYPPTPSAATFSEAAVSTAPSTTISARVNRLLQNNESPSFSWSLGGDAQNTTVIRDGYQLVMSSYESMMEMHIYPSMNSAHFLLCEEIQGISAVARQGYDLWSRILLPENYLSQYHNILTTSYQALLNLFHEFYPVAKSVENGPHYFDDNSRDNVLIASLP